MVKKLFFFGFFFVSIFNYSQKHLDSLSGSFVIIEATDDPGSSLAEFKILMTFKENSFNILYKIRDRFDFEKFVLDPKVNHARRRISALELKQNSDSLKYYSNIISDSYKIKDTTIIKSLDIDYNQEIEYVKFLRKFVNSSDDFVFESENYDRVIHGTYFKIYIVKDGKTRRTTIKGASKTRYKNIFRLVTETLNLYRHRNKDNFLHPLRTMKY